MKTRLVRYLFALAALLVAGCDGGTAADSRSGAVAAGVIDETGQYPSDISPPPGTEYPCALTPLPVGLPGIPTADREYINRTYARILRATQAKLVLLKAMSDRQGVAAATGEYHASAATLLDRLRSDHPPAGLEEFHRDVIAAIELQDRFFQKTVPMREGGASMEEVFTVSEGRAASGKLMSAWGAMRSRYSGWPPETKDSIYHHLCALDFF